MCHILRENPMKNGVGWNQCIYIAKSYKCVFSEL